MPKISFICPSIRTHLWGEFYDSIAKSTKADWELILVTPFADYPFKRDNVKIISSYASPSVCLCMGIEASSGEIIINCSDDMEFLPDSIDKCLEVLTKDNVVNMRYAESDGKVTKADTMDYWKPWTHPSIRLPGIPQEYWISLLFVTYKEFYYRVGGIDPNFDYLNLNLHDFGYRVQYLGHKVIQSPVLVALIDHGHIDHRPIEIANDIDSRLFFSIYSDKNALVKRSALSFIGQHNSLPKIWKIRFAGPTLPSAYSDLI